MDQCNNLSLLLLSRVNPNFTDKWMMTFAVMLDLNIKELVVLKEWHVGDFYMYMVLWFVHPIDKQFL